MKILHTQFTQTSGKVLSKVLLHASDLHATVSPVFASLMLQELDLVI